MASTTSGMSRAWPVLRPASWPPSFRPRARANKCCGEQGYDVNVFPGSCSSISPQELNCLGNMLTVATVQRGLHGGTWLPRLTAMQAPLPASGTTANEGSNLLLEVPTMRPAVFARHRMTWSARSGVFIADRKRRFVCVGLVCGPRTICRRTALAAKS